MTDYQKYQLQWMIDHDKSIDDLILALNAHRLDCDPEDDLLEVYRAWEKDAGFGGAIWACLDEWQDCEATTSILDAVYEQYLHDMHLSDDEDEEDESNE